MRYKGQFHGSRLLCPVSHVFIRIEKLKEKLAQHACCLMADEEEALWHHVDIRRRFENFLPFITYVVIHNKPVMMLYQQLKEVPKAKSTLDLYLDWWPMESQVVFVMRGFCVCW